MAKAKKINYEWNGRQQTLELSMWEKFGKRRCYVTDNGKNIGYYDLDSQTYEMKLHAATSWCEFMKAAVQDFIEEA